MERICRDGDERLYQPKIHSNRIRELYRIGQETGLPLTVLLDYSIGKFIEAYEKKKAERQALKDEVAWRMENEFNERDGPNDDCEDLSNYLDPYGEDY